MPLLDSKIEDAKKMFDVNVWAVVTVTQAFSPLLIAGHGKILNIGSGVGYIPVPFMGTSC
jgi:1-acylglycerone phosphate reductase